MQSAAEIAHKTHLDVSLVEEVMKLLQSKKSRRLVVFMHHKYRINYDVTTMDGVVSIPFSFPTLLKTDDTAKASLELNRGNQIDAVSMIVMKQQRSMEKVDLKKRVKEMLEFRLDGELFEKRMAHLAKNLYLKLDSSGRVHYLP
jgi:hypothetical protein